MLNITDYDDIVIPAVRAIDPGRGFDGIVDIHVRRGVITSLSVQATALCDAHVIRGDGRILCPGLADIHVHLREPGQEHKETIESGTRAAAAGGFTFVACMPNTIPALDTVEAIQRVLNRARQVGVCEVGPVAAITLGRRGEIVTDFASLKTVGAVAFSDDGVGVENDAVMREAFIRARDVDAALIQHCEYRDLSAGGVMHAGRVSERLGLPGLDPRSEEAMIERDIRLCRSIRARYHVAHISTAKAVELVRRAKAEGLPVTAEVTPHHLLLTDEACAGGDPHTKMHPPLRTAADVEACRAGLCDGTIDCVATDHAPHATDEKARGFLAAPPGVIGLETAVALTARAMIETGMATWTDLVRWFTLGPARVLRRRCGTIAVGEPADLTLIDPSVEWLIDPARGESLGRNTPFAGWSVRGRAVATIRGRQVAMTA